MRRWLTWAVERWLRPESRDDAILGVSFRTTRFTLITGSVMRPLHTIKMSQMDPIESHDKFFLPVVLFAVSNSDKGMRSSDVRRRVKSFQWSEDFLRSGQAGAFPTFYRNRRFRTMSARARHWTLSRAITASVHAVIRCLLKVHFNIILSSIPLLTTIYRFSEFCEATGKIIDFFTKKIRFLNT